ncbi:MAG: ADOP family duplicated permease [Terriglobales bacterium]
MAALDALARDLRYALRQLRRAPVFSAIAILTLALGLAATASVFSVVDGVLLQPLPYPHPNQLVSLELYIPKLASRFPEMPLNLDIYRAWQHNAKTLAGISLINYGDKMTLTGRGEPLLLEADEVTSNLFDVLGVGPQLGHGFHPGARHEAIITDALWRARFHADPTVLGGALDLDGAAYTLVGVLPAGFHFPTQNELIPIEADTPPAQVFVPPSRASLAQPSGFGWAAIARLRPGVSPAAARAELDAILARQSPQWASLHVTTVMMPLRSSMVRTVRRGLWMLLAAVLAVLLIICVNLANLLLTRASAREREAAIRSALGATHARLLRQALTETVLLGVLGGILGLALAHAALRGLLALVPAGLPRAANVHLNLTVAAVTFAAAILAALAAGILPALRFQLAGAQMQRGAEARSHHLRQVLVASGTALTTVLLIASGLLLASFSRLAAAPTGYAVDNVTTTSLQLSPAHYATHADQLRFWNRLLAAATTMPGVHAAAFTNILPLSGEQNDDPVTPLGDHRPAVELPWASYRRVSPGFFNTLGIPLLAGRLLTPADTGSGAVVISQSAAQEIWPGRNPLGQRFDVFPGFPGYRVVGVVANTRGKFLDQAVAPMIYELFHGDPAGALVLRSSLPAAALARELHRTVAALDPQIAVPPLRSLGQIVAASLAPRRFQALVTSLFALAALLLASLGIYGVVAFSVLRRRHEMAIRLALGAQPAAVLRLLLAQGMRPVLAGLAAAFALTRLLSSLLYGIGATDPAIFAAAVVLLAAVALAACLVPALRAARLNPTVTLRQE